LICCSNSQNKHVCVAPINHQGTCPTSSQVLHIGTEICNTEKDCQNELCCYLKDCDESRCIPISSGITTVPTDPASQSKTTSTGKPLIPPTLPVCDPRNPQTNACPPYYLPCTGPSLTCSGGRLCCRSWFSRIQRCLQPLGFKEGNCPPAIYVRHLGTTCAYDTNCPGRQKCCGSVGCSAYFCV